jgi:uncharacterized repeat protein (TIGR01451 family)
MKRTASKKGDSLKTNMRFAVLALLACVLTFPSQAAPATGCSGLKPATNFAAGTGPNSVAIGDFNGDGFNDLAVANERSSNVSILLGTGTGTFGAPTNFLAGTTAASVAVADFNGDGRSDLAVANSGSDDLSILLGTGTGAFLPPTSYPAGTRPLFVAAGDFNGDGKSDLAIANQSSNNVSILMGTGAGTFGSATNFTAGSGPSAIAVADFNGDGLNDLAVANQFSNDVSILLGNGTGSFGAATSVPAGSSPRSVAVADFNGDGLRDLAVANSSKVSVLLGAGAGSFAPLVSYPSGQYPVAVAVGDFNLDGVTDLVVANASSDSPGTSNSASIMPGTGTGTFGTATDYPAGLTPSALAVGDLNGDGRTDVVVANFNSNNVSVLLNTAPGALSFSTAASSVNESAGSATITVNRTGGSDCSVTVNYATADGIALAGSDYTTTSGTLTFAPGVLSQSFTVPILDDAISEASESFNVTLTNPTGGATVVAPTVENVTIVDDDPLPTFTIDNVSQAEGNSGSSNFVFTVTLAGATAQMVTVNYATADVTALAGSDYSATSGLLKFAPGVTSQTITVPVAGDLTTESDETFNVVLSTPVDATITTGTGTGTIVNDDLNADLSIVKSVAGSGPFFATQNGVFNITVSNAGPSGASNVTVTDILPAGVTLVSAIPSQGSCSATSTVTCDLGSIASAATATITLTVLLDDAGSISNTASVTSTNPDPTLTNNSASAPITVAPASAIPTLTESILLALAVMIGAIGVLRVRA